MKLLTTAFFIMLSIAAAPAQTATANPPVPATGAAPAPIAGYFVFFPQVPLITIHFDATSEDIAKPAVAPHPGTSINHDGTAFKSLVRPTSSESLNDNVVDYARRDLDIGQYKKNVKSGKWIGFANGE